MITLHDSHITHRACVRNLKSGVLSGTLQVGNYVGAAISGSHILRVLYHPQHPMLMHPLTHTHCNSELNFYCKKHWTKNAFQKFMPEISTFIIRFVFEPFPYLYFYFQRFHCQFYNDFFVVVCMYSYLNLINWLILKDSTTITLS